LREILPPWPRACPAMDDFLERPRLKGRVT
jgi:hypothetical protein